MNEDLKGTAKEAIEKIVAEVTAGLRHGYFEIRLQGEIVSGKKRRLTISAGKSHRYTLSEEEILK